MLVEYCNVLSYMHCHHPSFVYPPFCIFIFWINSISSREIEQSYCIPCFLYPPKGLININRTQAPSLKCIIFLYKICSIAWPMSQMIYKCYITTRNFLFLSGSKKSSSYEFVALGSPAFQLWVGATWSWKGM